ncbi:DUF2398 family protein [Kitasatospora sp. NPDC054939]
MTVTAGAAVRAGRPDAPQPGATAPAARVLSQGRPPARERVAPEPGPDGERLSPDPGLLRLAHWFAAAEPQAAHDLCAAAFGLYPARHFGAPAEDAAGDTAGAAVSWWHGPTAYDSATLRVRESRTARGGLRRAARREGAALPGPTAPGRHRRPERCGPSAAPQDRSVTAGTAAERRIAARLLLAHPLVTAAGPHAEGFPLIRRHRDWLVERFDALLGYRLVVGPRHARLHKAGLGAGAVRTLRDPATGTPLTPGAYAQLALALALLVDAPEHLPLARLLDGLRDVHAAPAELATALAVLADWQVIAERPAPDAPGDTLLTVDRDLARAVPGGHPALADDAADFVHRATGAAPATAVRRRLAETPAVLAADLTADQRDWLHRHRDREPAVLADFLGLEAEVRAEGVALLDPAEELTDLALPGPDTLAQAALLLVERLVDELRPLPGEPTATDVPVPDALIDGALGDVADEYADRAGWGRDYLADRTALRRGTLDLLHRMGLITPNTTRLPSWLLRAPAARYAPPLRLDPDRPGHGRHSRPEL